MSKILCVICMDNPFAKSQRTGVSIENGRHLVRGTDVFAYFGNQLYQVPDGTTVTAARAGYLFARNAYSHTVEERRTFNAKTDIHLHDGPEITSRTAICRTLVQQYLMHGHTVTLTVSGISKLLTRWLIRRECRRHGLNWRTVRGHLNIIACGGTFFYNVGAIRPWLFGAVGWWLWHVAGNELHQTWLALNEPDPEREPNA